MLVWVIAIIGCLVSSASLAAVVSALGVADPLQLGDSREASRARRLIANRETNLNAGRMGVWLLLVASGALWVEAAAQWIGYTPGWQVLIPVVFLVVVLVFLYALLGYQLPQRLGVRTPEATLGKASLVAEPLLFLLRPIARVADWGMNKLLPRPNRSELTAHQQISRLLARSSLDIGLEETSMLVGVLELREKTAKDIMTPTPAVAQVQDTATIKEAAERCVESGHTRLIVTKTSNQGGVAGVVHAADLLRNMLLENDEQGIEPLTHQALLVPPRKPLDQLLLYLQHRQQYLAVVTEEYGRIMGIVSIEDVIEEIVGEIEDETDAQIGEPIRLEGGEILVEGYMPIEELRRHGIDLPALGGVKSIGGYVFSTLGRLPKEEDQISAGDYKAKVDSMDENRVAIVRIWREVGQ